MKKPTLPRGGHAPGHIRDALLDAFENFDKEWWESFGSTEEALTVLGRLWNCRDVVPHHVRDAAADWLEGEGDEEASKLRAGCSYAQLVRRLRPALANRNG